MRGGACGAAVPGVMVGMTEWERPARLKFAVICPELSGQLIYG